MKALVTGATGFVGSHLVETLRRRGDEVTALVRAPARAATLEQLGIRLVLGSLGDRTALDRAAVGQDVVFHVAGVTAARSETEFLEVNRDGTTNVLEAATRVGVRRFLLVSSLAAGGPSEPGHPVDGTEPPRPVTAYGRSKLAAEAVVRGSTLQWTILRPPVVYGPRDREVLKVFRIARLGVAPVFGDGAQELSAVHAADLARALVAAAATDRTIGRIYCPSHPQTFTSAGFVRAVGGALGRSVAVVRVPGRLARIALSFTEGAARLTGRATILSVDKANEFFQAAWTCDPAPCTQDTGWVAEFDLEHGLADTCQWYRSAGWI